MQVQRGMVAHSMAGRDKGTVCAVLDYQAPYAWISDGKRRPLERPKKETHPPYPHAYGPAGRGVSLEPRFAQGFGGPFPAGRP